MLTLTQTTGNPATVATLPQAVGTSSQTEAVPPLVPTALHVACTACKKVLMKGQTAYQRKGSSDLFCSTACLSSHRPAPIKPKPQCHFCLKFIASQREVILAPVDSTGSTKDFCSNNCLLAFNSKRNSAMSTLASPASVPKALPSKCSHCTKYCISKHEVILKGSVHKLCSDECFVRFRATHKLIMSTCWTCGQYCYSKALTLNLDNINKTFCKTECVAAYKQKFKKPSSCTMCRASRPVCDMVEITDGEGKVDLFCTSSCVMAYKVQTVSASGAALKCDNCHILSVPAYHLAMSDASIRNFCTLPCVLSFQEKYNKTNQKSVVAVTTSTATTTAGHDVEPSLVKLSCSQCHSFIATKPELVHIKKDVFFFCGAGCSEDFKKAKMVTEVCEYCKTEKVPREVFRINNKDCAFCSEGCKLLYRHDLNKCWGKHCISCAFCTCTSQKLVTGQYGGKDEDFCSEDCRSKFTLLFCQIARCDLCCRQCKLEEKIRILGEIKYFSSPMGNLTSFQNLCCKASTQTDTGRAPLPSRALKNKSLMCKPMVQNKGVICKPQMVHNAVQTDGFPKILVLPVPVPVFVPVPMNMYSQYTPKAFAVPIPLPVPMFLPVTLDNAERIVETIQEIKEKIPSNPFEADLILMAEMVAEGEQDEKDVPKGHKALVSVEVETVETHKNESGSWEPPKLQDKYGVDAWKRWIQWRNEQPNMEKPRFGSRPLELKEDILRCTTTELSYGLCRFVAELKRPNGQPYRPDSLFYLCLGIQQFLFDNGRIENIFTDVFYSKFSMEITTLLKGFKPDITDSGYIHSRVEEEYLWHCKQLGAYSPIVLLNTLLFFCTKHFGFKTVAQHRQLSFAHIMRCTKSNPDNTKTNFLRFYPPISLKTLNAPATEDGLPAKKRKVDEEKEEVLEMFENADNPLRCPVRLYEFYLSKCSESVKQRTTMFYLNPERSCVPNSPMWYSSAALDDNTMETMLTRILTVREMHLHLQTEQQEPKDVDPPFIPSCKDQEDSD
ncbi:zinc finger MYM-type protein 4-like [Aplochiton taeniatus]